MAESHAPLDAKHRAQLRDEGKARLMWGDAPGRVREWLSEQGFSNKEIDQVLAEGARERAQAVRDAGFDDLIAGFVFMVIFGGIFLILFFSRLRFALIDFSGLIGSAYGLYLMLRGVYRLMEGGSYQGSITDLSKDD